MLVNAFNPSSREARVGDLCEFKVHLVYRVGWVPGPPGFKEDGFLALSLTRHCSGVVLPLQPLQLQ